MFNLKALRTTDRIIGSTPKRFCSVYGCQTATMDEKPYCIAHIDRLPYVRQLRAELARRDHEADEVASGNVVDVNASTRAREILERVAESGAQTIERLAQRTELTHEAAEGYARSLERAGLVRIVTIASRRGKRRPRTVVALAKAS